MPGADELDARALELAERLLAVLEAEFNALKSQHIDRFEDIQATKESLLLELSAHAARHDDRPASATSPTWANVKDLMRRCRDAHRRNEILVRHQLTAVQTILQALTDAPSNASVDLYDRSGRITARLGHLTDGNG